MSADAVLLGNSRQQEACRDVQRSKGKSHSGGHRFDPVQLHQHRRMNPESRSPDRLFRRSDPVMIGNAGWRSRLPARLPSPACVRFVDESRIRSVFFMLHLRRVSANRTVLSSARLEEARDRQRVFARAHRACPVSHAQTGACQTRGANTESTGVSSR